MPLDSSLFLVVYITTATFTHLGKIIVNVSKKYNDHNIV